jgi:hypothetical protein
MGSERASAHILTQLSLIGFSGNAAQEIASRAV